MLTPHQPFACKPLERDAGAHDLDVAAARIGEDRVQRGLSAAAVVVAGRRRTLVRPLRAERLVDLAPAGRRRRVGRAVLDVPDPALLALDAVNVAADVGKKCGWKEAHAISVARGSKHPSPYSSPTTRAQPSTTPTTSS